jgi:hypothetical protein
MGCDVERLSVKDLRLSRESRWALHWGWVGTPGKAVDLCEVCGRALRRELMSSPENLRTLLRGKGWQV